MVSLRAGSPIWASKASLARMGERGAPRHSLARSRETRFVKWVFSNGVLFLWNKNALSSGKSRLLGDETRLVLLSKTPVLLYYFFVLNTLPGKRVLHVIMYILKKKNCKERQAAHLSLKPVWNLWTPSTYWYCFIEEYSFRDFILEKLNDVFIGVRGLWLCQYKYT